MWESKGEAPKVVEGSEQVFRGCAILAKPWDNRLAWDGFPGKPNMLRLLRNSAGVSLP